MKLPALALLVGFAFGTSVGSAQHFLGIDDHGQLLVVVAARGMEPLVQKGDQLKMIPTSHFVLGEGGQYLPCYVAVRHVRVGNSWGEMRGRSEVNTKFHFSCDLETGYALANVFAVILINREELGEKGLYFYEVGNLEPYTPRSFHVTFPLPEGHGPGKYRLYLFSGGRELFHSRLPADLMAAALDRMVRERLKDVRDASAQPFVGPTPEYPEALVKQGTGGSATVRFTIGPNGAVSDPAVSEASQPEFGEAAMEAIRQWRFLPMVKDGVPVPTLATMPFVFPAPKKT
jgi:TonB family protein